MTQDCIRCGVELRGRAKHFRRYLQAQGWTCFESGGCLYWLCGACSAKKQMR